jgi:hypothetical protein
VGGLDDGTVENPFGASFTPVAGVLDPAERRFGRRDRHVADAGVSPISPPDTPLKPVEQITTGFDGGRWVTTPEAVA